MAQKTGVVFFPAFDWAITPTHPEREERLLYTRDQLFEEGIMDLPQLIEYKPRVATYKDIARAHFCVPDIQTQIINAHLIAVGGTLVLADALMDDQISNGFAMVRPPGHHAMRVAHGNRGFCNINNEAIMIEYLRQKYDIQKIAIVDTDVHHGDGTQDIFYHDPDVLFISFHQDGRTLYPGSGFCDELGGPNAFGLTLNIPMMLYFSFIKKRINIVIPITLALIALISVFGPLSSYSVSIRSQNNRLQAILIKNDMLQEGKIKTAPADISRDDKYEISRKLDYFSQNHSLQEIKCLPQNFKMVDMEKVFGFPYTPYESPFTDSHGFFYLKNSQYEGAVEIQGYDYLFGSMLLHERSAESTGSTIEADYDYQSSVVRVYRQGTLLYEKNLNPFVRELYNKHQPTAEEKSIPSEEMTLVEENEQVKVKFIFLHIMGDEDMTTGDVKLERAEFYLLVKIK
jgi:hypothetical protein